MKDTTEFLKANSEGGLVPINIFYIDSKGLQLNSAVANQYQQ